VKKFAGVPLIDEKGTSGIIDLSKNFDQGYQLLTF
jgi:hypothetical protein